MARWFQWQTLWEGRWIFAILLALGGIFGLLAPWISPWWVVLPTLGLLFSINFFRDPQRDVPTEPGLLVAPADGLITDIEQLESIPHLGIPGFRLSIFLSVFDVHVNRSPIAGTVLHREEKVGAFLDARHAEAHLRNASCTWCIEETGSARRIVVRQITGAIARRIVPWCNVGDTLQRGQRFGMIRFGSRTDLFVPLETTFLVEPGHKVKGGATPVARWAKPVAP
jgi:phosphatidylserine decarboxylase